MKTERLITRAIGEYYEKWMCRSANINTSGIRTALIKEAAKCEHYASDIFILWNMIEERMESENFAGETFLFGFRDDGVDDKQFISERNREEYRAIYELEVKVDRNKIAMELRGVQRKPEFIPRMRLEEIATKALHIAMDLDAELAAEEIVSQIDLTEEESEWFGLGCWAD